MTQYEIKNLSVIYGKNDSIVYAVKNADLSISKGEILSIVGKSGAGKSTLLNVLGGLEKPSSGKILFNGMDITDYPESKLSKMRLNCIGTVFQGCYLVSTMTVYDNIILPAIAAHGSVDKLFLSELIGKLGIKERLEHMPSQLSGGEKQRVAIARALINRPDVILADEPTGNLDSVNSCNVFELLINCAKEYNSTLIYVTHDEDKAKLSTRKLIMKDGIIFE